MIFHACDYFSYIIITNIIQASIFCHILLFLAESFKSMNILDVYASLFLHVIISYKTLFLLHHISCASLFLYIIFLRALLFFISYYLCITIIMRYYLMRYNSYISLFLTRHYFLSLIIFM